MKLVLLFMIVIILKLVKCQSASEKADCAINNFICQWYNRKILFSWGTSGSNCVDTEAKIRFVCSNRTDKCKTDIYATVNSSSHKYYIMVDLEPCTRYKYWFGLSNRTLYYKQIQIPPDLSKLESETVNESNLKLSWLNPIEASCVKSFAFNVCSRNQVLSTQNLSNTNMIINNLRLKETYDLVIFSKEFPAISVTKKGLRIETNSINGQLYVDRNNLIIQWNQTEHINDNYNIEISSSDFNYIDSHKITHFNEQPMTHSFIITEFCLQYIVKVTTAGRGNETKIIYFDSIFVKADSKH